MRREQMIKAANLFLLLIWCLAITSGCKSGMLGNRSMEWKRPDLSRMAFWRKESDEIPRPPALHFEPTPTGNPQIARSSAQPEPMMAGKNSKDDSLPAGDLNLASQGSSSKALEDLSHLADDMGNRPIRTPYQMTTEEPVLSNETGVASSGNERSAEQARSDFLAGMNSVPSGGDSAGFAAPVGFTADSPTSQTKVLPASNPLFTQLPSDPPPTAEPPVAPLEQSSAYEPENQSMSIGNSSARSLQPIRSDAIPVAPSLGAGSSAGDRDFLPLVAPSLTPDNRNPAAGSSFASESQSSFSAIQPQDFEGRSQDLSVAARPEPIRSAAQPVSSGDIPAEAGNSGVPFNQRVKNFANDVDIPRSVLQRKGSFAPGSLQTNRNFY